MSPSGSQTRPVMGRKISRCLKNDKEPEFMIWLAHHEEDLYIKTVGVDDSTDLLNVIVGVLLIYQLPGVRSGWC